MSICEDSHETGSWKLANRPHGIGKNQSLRKFAQLSSLEHWGGVRRELSELSLAYLTLQQGVFH